MGCSILSRRFYQLSPLATGLLTIGLSSCDGKSTTDAGPEAGGETPYQDAVTTHGEETTYEGGQEAGPNDSTQVDGACRQRGEPCSIDTICCYGVCDLLSGEDGGPFMGCGPLR